MVLDKSIWRYNALKEGGGKSWMGESERVIFSPLGIHQQPSMPHAPVEQTSFNGTPTFLFKQGRLIIGLWHTVTPYDK